MAGCRTVGTRLSFLIARPSYILQTVCCRTSVQCPVNAAQPFRASYHRHTQMMNGGHVRQHKSLSPPFQQCIKHERLHPCLERYIHTSRPRHAPPLALWLAVKTFAKTAAILTGRTLRNRWKKHPKHKHLTVRERLHANRGKLAAGLVGMLAAGVGYYWYHIDYTPLTNRPRFIIFNGTQFQKIVEDEYKMHCEQHKDDFVPTSHPIYGVITDVVTRLIQGNQDVAQIRNQTWTIHVVNSKNGNAFVLPNGHIFVFAGVLEMTDNLEQLGTVLAHEMAHVVLSHAAEMVSFMELFDFFMIAVLTALWTFLPNDGIALVATWFKQKVIQLLIQMPYNRVLETEADEVGLMLAAKSCFDVRECQQFWETVEAKQTAMGEAEPLEFLSTHPSHLKRAAHIQTLLPKALQVRQYCNCPPLPMRISGKARAAIRAPPASAAVEVAGA
ncbi:metalloendopeptidase OMA1, mitochondrial-like [Diadema setosum]|uniref:metalloendopeptidase OMA1, mitochondrial-like n=1 Tax=Diadema setosum TaxID=31175 RepID=UPI003B3BA29D